MSTFSDTTSDTDALVAACAAGDPSAWTALVGRYEGLVYGLARREGLDVEEAGDVAQQVFEALLRRIDTLRDPGHIGSWLMTVTRRTAWRQRDRARRESPVQDVEVGIGGQRDLVTTDPNDGTTAAIALHDALHQLGGPCEVLLVSLYLDPNQPSYHEIALRIGRPVGAIGPTRARCLDKLRRLLDESIEGAA